MNAPATRPRSSPSRQPKKGAARSDGNATKKPDTAATLPRVSVERKQAPEDGGLRLGFLPEFIGYPLRRAQIAVFDDFMRTMERVGLRPGQFSTLLVIEENPGSKQSDVAAALGIQNTNFVALINHLQGRGLVERRPIDRRSYGLHLTAEGKKLLAEGVRLQSAQEATFDDLLGPGGRQMLQGLLARLTRGLESRNTSQGKK